MADTSKQPDRKPLFVIASGGGSCLKGLVMFPDQAEYAGHYQAALSRHLRNGEPMPYATPGDIAKHERIHGKHVPVS